jgi:hypothetical protein
MPHRTFPLRDCLGKAVWIGLALLVLGQLDFELSRPCASAGRKRSVEGKVDSVAVEAGAMKHCQH